MRQWTSRCCEFFFTLSAPRHVLVFKWALVDSKPFLKGVWGQTDVGWGLGVLLDVRLVDDGLHEALPLKRTGRRPLPAVASSFLLMRDRDVEGRHRQFYKIRIFIGRMLIRNNPKRFWICMPLTRVIGANRALTGSGTSLEPKTGTGLVVIRNFFFFSS